ncbi:DMT family transporter [Methylovulum miyakonense]|uniref:DMT family transporter n=1 Tax=Methylovulum miyakonense TaxID=645578 RepID=UPI00037C5741|nr:DMT family transporter [Methylovulum miyakonense]
MPSNQSPAEQRNQMTGFALVLLGAFGFSAKAILIKLAYAADVQIDAITLMALRMLFSLPFFLVVAFWNNAASVAAPMTGRQWLLAIALGLTGYYIASYLDFLGLQTISAGLERVILFLYPTFVVLLSALFHKRKISLRVGLALVLSYTGMLLVFMEQLSLASANILLGSALVLASAVTFAIFTMGSGVMTHSIGSTRFTAYTMTVASMATLAHFGLRHGTEIKHLSTGVYVLALVMAVFSTVLPSFFMNAGIRRIGASSASIISTTGPIATLALAFFILDEAITGTQLAGTFLVLAGVYVVSKK